MKNFSVKTADFDSLSISGEAPIVQSDLGTAPNQIPLNKDLGSLAYMNAPQIEDLNVDTLELREIDSEFQLFDEAGNVVDAVDVFVYDTRKDSDGGAWRSRTQHTSWYNEELNTATRGGRREFPAVAVIVAESNKVTIYDGDDPDLSMWMVFQQGSVLEWASTSSNCTSLSFLNGILVVGSNKSSVILFNFLGDDIKLTYFQNQYFLTSGRLIVDRNNSISVSTGGDGIDVINNQVNDVAMTVLPNAPIDSETGLPVPTIAVATDGGVSVIKDDGSVVDISNPYPMQKVSFDLNGQLHLARQDSNIYYYGAIPSSDITETDWRAQSDVLYVGNVSSGADIQIGDNDVVDIAPGVIGLDDDVDSSLVRLDINKNSLAESMINFTNSRYNTGWMPGDIKLATLSDSTVETVGEDETTELLVDDSSLPVDQQKWVGDFNVAADLDAWELVGDTAGITIVDNKLRIIRSTTLTYATIAVNVIEGKKYVVSGTISGNSGGGAPLIRVSSARFAGTYIVNDMTGDGDHFRSFTATSTRVVYVGVGYANASGQADFDNISVKQTGELITNGTFDNGTTGWTSGDGATVTESSSALSVVSGSLDGYAYQAISTIVGKSYTLSFDYKRVSGSIGIVRIGTSAGTQENWYSGSTQMSSYEFTPYNHTFVATSTTTYVSFWSRATGGEVHYDNISVRLAEEDRSVNDNGLQVFGEIDKTPVAPGADLVAYSGFSEENYLVQPYNSDLDFGTGDFCVMGWFKGTSTNGTILDRANSGATLGRATLTFSTYLEFKTIFNGATITCASNKSISDNTWHYFSAVRRDRKLSIYIDGFLSSSEEDSNHDLSNPDAYLNVGLRYNLAGSLGSGDNLALLRVGATAPTEDQIAKIYRDEKPLFQDGAQATLHGTSDAVTALAYDDSENLLHVGTASGRSSFNGLKRVDNTTTAVTTAISATEGLVIEQ